jgi:hypothetical protein
VAILEADILLYEMLSQKECLHQGFSELVGCSYVELRKLIESKFTEGMTWENWSVNGWHIDHIKPLSSFDLTDTEQLKEACSYNNLQPLWAKDNLKKSDH